MAKFTDIFIQRPVLATVISLLLLIVGARALFDMQVRQYPKMENTKVIVTTAYPGASAQLVEGFITTPIEKEVASAEGIDYMTSSSTDGVSTITAYVTLNFDPNVAFTNILSKVQEAEQDLPKDAEQPVLDKQTGQTFSLMYLSFSSKKMSAEQITDYLTRVVQPKLETLKGVASAQILGAQTYAMRIWLNTTRMAGLGVTPNDVQAALLKDNFLSAAGHTKGEYVEISINPKTNLETPVGFENIVVKTNKAGALVRLKDVAKVELGSQTYDASVFFNGEKAVFIGINSTPSANSLSVINQVKKVLPGIEANFPPTLQGKVVYDATKYIRSSIHEVMKTIAEATLIVVIIIFLFMGSLRTVIIPVVTIPLSLVGVCFLMLLLGYSINLLTLLSMVLAIGMVVDDAIVVVENIYRHIEEGLSPREAAIKGAREIATPIITMTITLAAVYAPIGFMGGITGALFKEFAFTLASAVIISGVIALTLSPMMCSRVLTADIGKQRFVHYVDAKFDALKNAYQRFLTGVLHYRGIVVFFAFVVLTSCFFLYANSQKELAPNEDQGVVFAFVTGPQSASLKYMEKFTNQFSRIYRGVKSLEDYFIINGFNGVNTGISAIILKPWDERKQTQQQVIKKVQKEFQALGGLQIQAVGPPVLPTGGSPLPIQFVITSTSAFTQIYPVMQQLVTAAQKSGLFLFIDGSLRFNKPQIEININRSKAAQLGVGINDIAQALATSFGGNYVNRFSVEGQNYEVIPQVFDEFRYNPETLEKVYVRTKSNKLIPLSTVTSYKFTIQPNILSRFQQLNSATLEGMMMPGRTIMDGLNFLQTQAKKILPQGVTYDYAGQSRQAIEEGGALIYTFFFSIIVIFLVLSAQFESFRDPLVVMTSVPMAICGALLATNWGLATVNIYTQIGLITLIGLISKHGILMVDFANSIRDEKGVSRVDAMIEAASIRLRPVLMTTFSMILGVVPLILATGAGAHSRFDIGLIIAMGMAIGTLFTLFVVPTMYTLKAKQILLLLLSVVLSVGILYQVFYVMF